METAKSSKLRPLIAALAGFLAGCTVMYFVRSHKVAREETEAPIPAHTLAPTSLTQAQAQAELSPIALQTGVRPMALRGAEARHVLNEIKRDKTAPASVNVRFFATDNGKLSQQFRDFFEISSDEADKLSGVIQTTRAEMWNAAKAQAKVSQTETGGVVVEIPPIEAGADIYDKVMDGFQAVLGGDRFNDMMLYSGNQFERLFNQFGGEERTVTMERRDVGRYEIKIETATPTEAGVGRTSQRVTMNPGEIKEWKPELLDFIPAE